MSQVNVIKDSEFELLYNSLFGTPTSVSVNKENNKKYVNFMVNPLITGDQRRVQSVELDKSDMSYALQERKARIMEFVLLTSKNSDLMFRNADVAKTDIRENMKLAVNFPTKFAVMSSYMYSNLKPEIETEMIKDLAKNIATLKDQNLISESAVNFATEQMMGVDSRFKTLLNKEMNKEEEAAMTM